MEQNQIDLNEKQIELRKCEHLGLYPQGSVRNGRKGICIWSNCGYGIGYWCLKCQQTRKRFPFIVIIPNCHMSCYKELARLQNEN